MVFKKISPYWIVISAIAALLWLPHLLSLGMFMDGVYNALLSENLFKGISSFWAPQTIFYSEPAYWDNPPLSMGLLAAFYKIFGDYYVVERIYSFVCAVVQLALIAILWRMFFSEDKKLKDYAWLPCLLWLASPLIGWCYSNNLMENTMSLFTTAALIVSVRYVQTQKHLILTSILAAAFLLLAFITKGPVSLFPLAFPVLFISSNNQYNIKKGIVFTCLFSVFFCLFFAGLFSFHGPNNFLHHYYEVQVKRALTHQMPGQYKPYEIFVELLIAISPFLVFSIIKMMLSKKIFSAENSHLQKISWRFILLGLCGSVPIALSIKQRKFYLLPAMVPFVMGFAAYLLPIAAWIKTKITDSIQQQISKLIRIVGILVVALAIVLCIVNHSTVTRDQVLLQDLKTLNEKLLPTETVLRADWKLYDNWQLRGYLLRLYGKKIAMPKESAPAHYYMALHDQGGDGLPDKAQKIFSGNNFDLYQLPK